MQGMPCPASHPLFWSISRAAFCHPSSSSFHLLEYLSFSGRHLIRAIKRHSIQATRGRKLTIHLSPRLQKVKCIAKLRPAQKIKKMSDAKLAPRTLCRFVLSSTQANLLKQVRGSLPAVASAFRR